MSYPDLGCFAECLTCELCETDDDPDDSDEIDLDLPDDYYDPEWDNDSDWYTDGPEPYEPELPDFPTGVPLGDSVEVSPTFDPPGIQVTGEF